MLLDTLLRPNGDVAELSESCLEWRYDPEQAVEHVVLGDAPRAGGQWADNPVNSTWNIGTLSYAEQLSLPGYSMSEFWQACKGEPLPKLVRPSRTDYAEYLAAYPVAVGIGSSIRTSQKVYGISRTPSGFHVASHDIDCKHIVLASGTFHINLQPPRSLNSLSSTNNSVGPVLIVGSGFTAADLIISTPPEKKIIHIFNWDPEDRPSPLKGCHSEAYPEYSWIYRQMRLAAAKQGQGGGRLKMGKIKNLSTLPYFSRRDWATMYAGYANADVAAKESINTGQRAVRISWADKDEPVICSVGSLHYAAGRRGTLDYLSPSLLSEILPMASPDLELGLDGVPSSPVSQRFESHRFRDPDPWGGDTDSPLPTRHASPSASSINVASTSSSSSPSLRSLTPPSSNSTSGVIMDNHKPDHLPHRPLLSIKTNPITIISGHTLRTRIEATPSCDLELAPGIFVIGSLTGDSLVRYAAGGCCGVAGKIMAEATRSGNWEPRDGNAPEYEQGKMLNGYAHSVKDAFGTSTSHEEERHVRLVPSEQERKGD